MHSVSDIFRRVELAVSVKECAVNEMYPGVEEGEMENAAGGGTETVDLTDDGRSSRKGNLEGRLWRVKRGMERW